MKNKLIVIALCATVASNAADYGITATAPEVSQMMAQAAIFNADRAAAQMAYPAPTLGGMFSETAAPALTAGRGFYDRAASSLSPYLSRAYASMPSMSQGWASWRPSFSVPEFNSEALLAAASNPRNQMVAATALILVGGLAWKYLSPAQKAAAAQEAEATVDLEAQWAAFARFEQEKADAELARRMEAGLA